MRKPTRASEASRRQMPASEFKAKCLRVLDEAASGAEIVITKHGKPVARLGPIAKRSSSYGSWKGMVEVDGDIVHGDWSQEFEVARDDR